MKKLKYSLRFRLAVILVGMTAGSIMVGVLINNIFLVNYYTSTKVEALIEISKDMDRAYVYNKESKEIETNEEIVQILRESGYNQGTQMLIVDTSYQIQFENMPSEDEVNSNSLLGRIRKMLFDVDSKDKKDVVAKASNYEIYKYKNEFNDNTYIEMWGELQCGYIYIMRVSNKSINEVVDIANQFHLNVGLILTMVGIIFTGIIATRVTKPIRELAKLSRKMCKLEFDVKYTGKAMDEIGILGESMNEMSSVLEKTISELKGANNELTKDIEKKTEIDELRKEFISNVSHELKTPIALIQGYAEGLKESVNDDVESREFYCDVIIDEATKMNKMVRKLLTLNQIEFGRIPPEYERFDITQIIDNILNQSQILLEEKGAVVDFDNSKPVYVWSDEFQIEEIITNYISNAINHLDYEKIIKITMIKVGKNIRICVENTGDPIPQESLKRIWEKFYKVDKARTREYGGSGIGLSIVKAIMKSLRMKYGVNNTETGVVFWFEVESGTEGK